MRAERELRQRGWALAVSPADADALLVCGAPGPELATLCDGAWEQLPGPRARVAAGSPGSVARALDAAAERLCDHAAQRRDACMRAAAESAPHAASGPADGASDGGHNGNEGHEGMEMGEDHSGRNGPEDHEGMDHGDMDMDMDMDMPMPGGIGLAQGGPDRDGLDLDVLNVPLGPVLAHWPAGLVLRCALQGDVISDAAVEVLRPGAPAPSDDCSAEALSGGEAARRLCVRRCDSAGRLLALAGSGKLSATAFGIRDGLLDGMDLGEAANDLRLLALRVGRSGMLRWSLREPAGVLDSLRCLLEEAVEAAESGATASAAGAPSEPGGGVDFVGRAAGEERRRFQMLPELVKGHDLAAARLLVAASDVDVTALDPARARHA
jgi:hypothetical protein